MSSNGPPVTIAVVSWNTRELLARCLESMQADADAGLAEVWVVDNASDDGSQDLVRERFAWAELVASEQNLGFGPAVNLVAERTESAWIAASNADIELSPGALAALLAAADADPSAGSLAPRLVMPDGETQHSVHSFPSLSLALQVNLGLAALVPGLGDRLCLEGRWDPERGRRVDWAHGAFLLVRRPAFEAAGRFDPRPVDVRGGSRPRLEAGRVRAGRPATCPRRTSATRSAPPPARRLPASARPATWRRRRTGW